MMLKPPFERGAPVLQAEADSLREDLSTFEDEFSLPIDQRPEENLRTDGLESATVDTQISSTNVGYRMLQRMGWSAGQGLGRDAQGTDWAKPLPQTNPAQHMIGTIV